MRSVLAATLGCAAACVCLVGCANTPPGASASVNRMPGGEGATSATATRRLSTATTVAAVGSATSPTPGSMSELAPKGPVTPALQLVGQGNLINAGSRVFATQCGQAFTGLTVWDGGKFQKLEKFTRALEAYKLHGGYICILDVVETLPDALSFGLNFERRGELVFEWQHWDGKHIRSGVHRSHHVVEIELLHDLNRAGVDPKRAADGEFLLRVRGRSRALRRASFRDKAGAYRHRLHQPRAVLALSSGETFVLGRDRKEGVLAVEWWSAKGGASQVASLPNHIYFDRWDPSYGPKFGQLVADGADRVYAVPLATVELLNNPYLARFDGKTWHAEDVSALPGSILDLRVGQGSVIVSSKGSVVRRSYGGDTWQQLPLLFEDVDPGVIVDGGRLVTYRGAVYFIPLAPSQR